MKIPFKNLENINWDEIEKKNVNRSFDNFIIFITFNELFSFLAPIQRISNKEKNCNQNPG